MELQKSCRTHRNTNRWVEVWWSAVFLRFSCPRIFDSWLIISVDLFLGKPVYSPILIYLIIPNKRCWTLSKTRESSQSMRCKFAKLPLTCSGCCYFLTEDLYVHQQKKTNLSSKLACLNERQRLKVRFSKLLWNTGDFILTHFDYTLMFWWAKKLWQARCDRSLHYVN